MFSSPYRQGLLALVGLCIIPGLCAEKSGPAAYARFVPERKDDFAFENDKVAFRIYGPDLKDSAENSGIDCWLKRVDYPIIDKWYSENAMGKSYHKDHGEGYDPYKVGSSLGCGGLALWIDGKLVQSNVFQGYRIKENGPSRVVFEIDYAWEDIEGDFTETRRFTLALGSQLFKAESQIFSHGEPTPAKVAIGIATDGGQAMVSSKSTQNTVWISAWQSIHDAHLGTGAILDKESYASTQIIDSDKSDRSHIALIANTDNEGRIVYHAGFAWSKAGEIVNLEDWIQYLNTFSEK